MPETPIQEPIEMTEYPNTLIHYDNKVVELDPSRILVCFRQPTDREEVQQVATRLRLSLEDHDRQRAHSPRDIINHTKHRYWLRSSSGKAISDDTSAKFAALSPIAWVAPVYWPLWSQETRARFSLLPNVLLVRYRSHATQEEIRRIEEKYGLERNDAKSRHLGGRFFYDVNLLAGNAYALRDNVAKEPAVMSTHYSSMPMHSPLALRPNDEHFGDQWNLGCIGAEDGWDVTTGDPGVVIGILDSGCNMEHEDLQEGFDETGGYNASTGRHDGSDPGTSAIPGHGTCVAGIAAARIGNARGIAGVAGECKIHAVAIPNYTDDEVDGAIREAVDAARVQVINMSFRDIDHSWDTLELDATIDYAYHSGVFLCAAAANVDQPAIGYPALHPEVVAVGAIDRNLQRAQDQPGDLVPWGSSYGGLLDVVAPGVDCMATALLGGYGSFAGTSAAGPHVAGLAALLLSAYRTLSVDRVRSVIEQTCEKVRPDLYAYTLHDDHPNGPWNEEMGYGLINIDRALRYADVVIRDHLADNGSLPSNPEDEVFWDSPDIGIKREDDGVFGHDGAMIRGQTNYVYVQVTNLGPAQARDVTVRCRAVSFSSTEFEYPRDWESAEDAGEDGWYVDATAIEGTFSSIAVDGSALARFELSAEEVHRLHNWETSGGHPCILAQVRCTNDYNEAVPGHNVWSSNNLAQKNVSTTLILAGSGAFFSFISGHPSNAEPCFELVIDRHGLPAGLELFLDPYDAIPHFPGVELKPPRAAAAPSITFLERTRLGISACGCEGVLTLEAGSTFSCSEETVQDFVLHGAQYVMHQGKRLIAIRNSRTSVRVAKGPGERRQFVLRFDAPSDAKPGTQYRIDVAQRSVKGQTVGGVTWLARIA
jgi:hypothetical protein